MGSAAFSGTLTHPPEKESCIQLILPELPRAAVINYKLRSLCISFVSFTAMSPILLSLKPLKKNCAWFLPTSKKTAMQAYSFFSQSYD
jgi:hypothetical protein